MRALVIASLLVALVAASAPALIERRLGSAADIGSRSEATATAPAAARAQSGGSRQVEIKAHKDGHFYVDAEINSGPCV
jgi:predicted aspartyl protease